jgi:hypothetical protein
MDRPIESQYKQSLSTPIVQCMGGWCKKREQCAHFWARRMNYRKPVDRLCGKFVEEPEPIVDKKYV